MEEVTDQVTESCEVPDEHIPLSYSEIAEQLLSDRLLLTALELHCELVEAGKEIPKLKDFFSNPGNFESIPAKAESSQTFMTKWTSQTTLDSLDLTRFSEDGDRNMDDRVAILEFELRQAKETINALRKDLTVATESDVPAIDGLADSKINSTETIKPHEKRALNFLINEYLLLHNYTLTSITFADENEDQDFEVWDDVGLNISKPHGLLEIYRDSMRGTYSLAPTHLVTVETQTEVDSQDLDTIISNFEGFKNLSEKLEIENKELTAKLENLECERMSPNPHHFDLSVSGSNSSDHFILVDDCNSNNETQHYITEQQFNQSASNENSDKLSHASTSDNISTNVKSVSENPSWENVSINSSNDESVDMLSENTEAASDKFLTDDILDNLSWLPTVFQKELYTACYPQFCRHIPSFNVDCQNRTEEFAKLVAASILRIAPNVVADKKDDLVDVTCPTIVLHPDCDVREKLIALLFTLKKKPQTNERDCTHSAFAWLIKHGQTSLIENELLPQFWEQLNSKVAEKRILTAEACGVICPLVSDVIRNSSIISLLQQLLLDDKDERVRSACVRSLALVTAVAKNEEKFAQCEELTLTGLRDHSRMVVETAINVLLPVLATWAFYLGRLQSHIFDKLLNLLQSQIKIFVSQKKQECSNSPFKQSSLSEVRSVNSLYAMRVILPQLVVFVANVDIVKQSVSTDLTPALQRIEFAKLCVGLNNPANFYRGEHSIGVLMSAFDTRILENSWKELDWVSDILIMKLLDAVESISTNHAEIFKNFISLFYYITCGFGKHVYQKKIKPIFIEKLDEVENTLANLSENYHSLIVLPIYIFGILVPLEDMEEIRQVLKRFIFATSLSHHPMDIIQFCVVDLSRNKHLEEHLMVCLWEGIVHARATVRNAALKLFNLVIPNVSDFAITTRIVPALVTLSNDPDMDVRISLIPVFATVINKTSVKEVSDKCYFQLQAFLNDESLRENHTACIQLINTLNEVAARCHSSFREEILIPQLLSFLQHASLASHARKQQMLTALTEAFSAVIYCSLSKNVLTNVLIPGLRQLESLLDSPSAQRETVTSMINTIEDRSLLNANSYLSSNPGISSVTNMGQEVKQRMSKIFASPMTKQGKFWKS